MVFAAQNNIISSLGFTTEENLSAMKRGISGVTKIDKPEFLPFPFYSSLINNDKLDEKSASVAGNKEYTRLEKIFILSITDVVKASKVDMASDKTLLIISTTKGNISLLEEVMPVGRQESLGGFTEKRLLLSEMANVIAGYFGMYNKPLVVSNACISGVLAIITAQRLIRSGKYDNVIVSGGDMVSAFTLSGFNSFKALSDEPCKPFDSTRKGINLGEGCGTLLLTADEKLLPPGVKKIIVSGGSVSNDANHISGPSRTGEELALSVKKALAEAGLEKNIDFISAHGTATDFNDEMEAKAFSLAGLENVPLNSMKGFFGHTLGAAGVIESVVTIESMKNEMLIPSVGFENSGVSKPLNIIMSSEKKELNNCLKTASGFGGCNGAVVFSVIKK